jgi:hypothetical protein
MTYASASPSREVERVHHLIKLAVDAGAAENESRNAAVMACRLIDKHGLAIVAHAPSEPYRAPPPPPPRPPPPQAHSTARGRVIYSRFATTCRACREPIEVGERIYWVRGEGSIHVGCGGDV